MEVIIMAKTDRGRASKSQPVSPTTSVEEVDVIGLEEDLPSSQDSVRIQVPELDPELENSLLSFDPGQIRKKQSSKDVTKQQCVEILDRVARVHIIDRSTVFGAFSELARRGAMNAGASDGMFVEVYCPVTGHLADVSRYDFVIATQSVAGHKTIRKVAETLAPEMISVALKLLIKQPMQDLKGDLANRIDRKLSLRDKDNLTRKEAICCCTYTQWMPNLNELAESTRLKSLLEEDLGARRKKGKKGNPGARQASGTRRGSS